MSLSILFRTILANVTDQRRNWASNRSSQTLCNISKAGGAVQRSYIRVHDEHIGHGEGYRIPRATFDLVQDNLVNLHRLLHTTRDWNIPPPSLSGPFREVYHSSTRLSEINLDAAIEARGIVISYQNMARVLMLLGVE